MILNNNYFKDEDIHCISYDGTKAVIVMADETYFVPTTQADFDTAVKTIKPANAPLSVKGLMANGNLSLALGNITVSVVMNTTGTTYQASLGVATKNGDTREVIIEQQVYWDAGNTPWVKEVTLDTTPFITDNDLGYTVGDCHILRILDKTDLSMYEFVVMTTNNGTSDHCDIAVITARRLA